MPSKTCSSSSWPVRMTTAVLGRRALIPSRDGQHQRSRARRPRGHRSAGGPEPRPGERRRGAGCTCGSTCPTKETRTSSPAHAPRLPHQPADLGQSRHHPIPAGRRRLREDTRADRLRPLSGARPDRDPVRARPAGSGPARPQGGLRREPIRDAAVPEPRMPYEVAATAWTQLMGCKRYEGAKTLDAIRDFRDQFRGRGPEAGPDHP